MAIKCTAILLAVFGVLMFVGGLAIQFLMSHLVNKQAEDMIPLKDDDSALFEPWVDHGGYGSPIYNEYYMWNLTNPDEFLEGEKPILDRLGPFVYRMFDWREDVTWIDNNEKIKFTYHNYNVFLPERTDPKWKLDAMMYAPNYALQGALLAMKSINFPHNGSSAWPYLKRVIMEDMKIFKEGLILHRTVEEVLWGFNDPILTSLCDVLDSLGLPRPTGLAPYIGLQYIDTPEFYNQPSVQYSGTSDFHLTATFVEWCGNTNLTHYWPLAGEITGTDGWQFSPNPSDTIQLFIDAMPAVVDIVYKDHFTYLGIKTHRYVLSPDTFNATSHWGKTHHMYSAKNGVVNVSISQGASIFLSKPMFLDADPEYLENITMDFVPNRSRDDTNIYIEPITGNSVAAEQRIQVNLQMENWLCEVASEKGPVPESCNLTGTYVPVMYFEQLIHLPPSEADLLKGQIYGMPNTFKTIGWVIFAVSFAVAIWVAALIKHHMDHKKKHKQLLANGVLQDEDGYKAVPPSESDNDDVGETEVTKEVA
eukprot:TRINITY_DN652_c1_g1_i1.p1 TRINITY_DN652_c1_g1~~TRINITY_DN652_c1_g1_i1.p1  ORF type:complete len:534 (+),score=78.42 TRINITY_DN652_c1_g1_i1:45-1646(+)